MLKSVTFSLNDGTCAAQSGTAVTLHLTNLAHRIRPEGRLIVPDGQISGSPVQPPLQKYSGSLLSQITSTSLASRPTHKGRFAIVTNVGQGCGGRGSTRAQTFCADERADADGEVVWS